MTFVQNKDSNIGVQIGLLVIYRVGFGFANQATNIAAQLILETVAPHMIAASTALIRFLLQVGIAISTAIFFSVMNYQVKSNVEPLQQTESPLYQRIIASGSYRDYVKINSIADKEVQVTLNSIYLKSILKVYYALIAVCAIANLCALLVRIPKMPEKKSNETCSIDS
jgi:hypothetical protein